MRLYQVSAGLGDFAVGETLLHGVLVEVDIDGFALDEGRRLILEDGGLRIDVNGWLLVELIGLLVDVAVADLRLMNGRLRVVVDDWLMLRQILSDDFLVD